MGAVLGS